MILHAFCIHFPPLSTVGTAGLHCLDSFGVLVCGLMNSQSTLVYTGVKHCVMGYINRVGMLGQRGQRIGLQSSLPPFIIFFCTLHSDELAYYAILVFCLQNILLET